MKKSAIILIIFSAIFLNANSQNVDEALRYSQIFYNGTARFMSMGGAFTALGGDLSAITLNPASTGVFRSFDFSITPQQSFNNTSSTWNGYTSNDYLPRMTISQGGGVFNLFPVKKQSGLVGLNLAYSFNKTNSFDENITISGVSNNSSMADYWVSRANGTYFEDLRGPEGLAFEAWIIDTLTNSGGSNYATVFSNYGTNTNATYGQTIKRIIENRGYSGIHAISIGGNLSDKFYFGGTFNISVLNYTGHYQHIEADYDNQIFDFKSFTYTDHFQDQGTGYSFDIGAIYRPVDFLRIGGAMHTPVNYRIHEYFYDNVTSEFDNGDNYEWANDALRYDYTLTTPFRANGGIAIQILKVALLSADYEYVDYTKARFSEASDNQPYDIENQDIMKILHSTSNLKFGAEYRIKSVYLRGGYSYYGNTFAGGEENKNMHYDVISGGIGMRQQNFYFDLAYTSYLSTSKYFMYYDPGYLEAATIKNNKGLFTMTMGFKF
jgi:hypothetical protein